VFSLESVQPDHANSGRRLTVKLRGRAEALALGAEGAKFLSARGAKQTTHHGPLQRLLDGQPLLPKRTVLRDVTLPPVQIVARGPDPSARGEQDRQHHDG
jgi:hypothetical protein